MKKALALLSNDWHLSKDNIEEFNKNWDEMLSVCKSNRIHQIVIGGDLFTSRSSQPLSVLLTMRNALDRAIAMDIQVTIAEGNHDCVDQESIYGYNHLWRGLNNIEIIDIHKSFDWVGCPFVLLVMSYFPETGSFLDKLEASVSDTLDRYPQMSKSDIVLYIHEGVHGALGDFEIPGELAQEPLLGFKSVLCGHYHNRAKIANTNIEYIGSSRQDNFGEDEEKGYTILYSDGTNEFVKNETNTRFQTVVIDYADIDNYQLKKDSRYKYKVKVRCNEIQAKNIDRKKLLQLGFNKVEIVIDALNPTEIIASDIQEKYDIQGIKKEYQNFCNDMEIDSSLGLKYFES